MSSVFPVTIIIEDTMPNTSMVYWHGYLRAVDTIIKMYSHDAVVLVDGAEEDGARRYVWITETETDIADKFVELLALAATTYNQAWFRWIPAAAITTFATEHHPIAKRLEPNLEACVDKRSATRRGRPARLLNHETKPV